MADFSNIDVERLVVEWEEEDWWNISGGNYHKKMQDTEQCSESKKTFLFFNNFIAAHSKLMNTVANTSSAIVDTTWRGKTRDFWSFVYNLIRLILVCVQESLIIQKSYNTSLVIQIVSCVPAFTRQFQLCD